MNLDFSQLKRLNMDGIELIKFSIGVYDNLVTKSIDTDGSIFNGCGYIDGYRLSSSGAIKVQANTVTTGFIPYTQNCIINMFGTKFTEGIPQGYHYLTFFDKNFKRLCHLQSFFNSDGAYSFTASGTPAINVSASTVSIDEFYHTSIKLVFNASTSNIAYFRINGSGSGSGMIVSTSINAVDTYNWRRSAVNLVPLSIDIDGSVYNNCGYVDGYTLTCNSQYTQPTLTKQANTLTTGYIPMTNSDKIRSSGVSWIPTQNKYIYSISFYDANFDCVGFINHVGGRTTDRCISDIYEMNSKDFIQDNSSATKNFITIDQNGVIDFNFVYSGGNPFHYIRISAGSIGSDMIVTKNEEII